MVSRRSAGLIGALVVGVAVLGLAAGLFGLSRFNRWRDGSSLDNALRRDVVPALATIEPGPTGPIAVIGEQPSSDGLITVAVAAPDDAEAIRIGTDPGFGSAPWQPIAPTIEVELTDAGYQTLFAQFLMNDGSVGETSVTAAVVDPTYAAATSSADGLHMASFLRPFSPTELLLRVEAGRLQRGAVEPYDLNAPSTGDRVRTHRGRLVVERDGAVFGLQVSQRTDAIRRPDRLIGQPLDIADLIDRSWMISSPDDPAYADGAAPARIRNVSRPGAGGVDDRLDRVYEVVHDIVITTPSPLRVGARYEIVGPSPLSPITIEFDPVDGISPAVRVNQAGFAPHDESKLAYLSGWFDGIGQSATDLDQEPGFRVVDVVTGDVAARGRGRLHAVDDEMGRGDLTGAPVVVLDFSSLTRPGRYQVCVTDIGCSHRFDVAATVWHRLTTTVARAMYHQRSGIGLGPPYTSVVRPRPYHPADGATVVASEYSLLRAQTETGNTDFELLAELGTDALIDSAWGGHFDAGDWDRRINHLWYARTAAQLVARFPETFAEREMNIPESGDMVPDLLDEALWTVDLYRRMQLPNGSIRGGIEASKHPPANTPSWADDLAVFAYQPDRFSSYLYAGVAAEMANTLAPYDRARADELLASALAAMEWAETADRIDAQVGVDEGSQGPQPAVERQRTVAAAALLLATGDAEWHDIFLRSADFLDDDDPYLSCHAHHRCDAAWLYLQVDESMTDPTIRAELRNRFITSADATIAAADGTAYGWTTENPFVPLVWGLGSGGAPHASGLLKAYLLSGNPTYRAAAVRSAGVALGANPMNKVLLTGVGTEPVRNPQINDVKYGGLPVWPGTPVYGHHLLNSLDDDSWVVDDILGPAGASPNPDTLPYLWQWYDVDSVALFNEFTVHQSHAEALLTFGTLAATSS